MPRPRRRQRVARPHCAQADQAHGLAGQLPGPVALVGDLAVPVDLAGPHVLVRREQAPRGREEEGDRQLGHGVGVAARARSTVTPAAVAAATSTLVGSPRQLATAMIGCS